MTIEEVHKFFQISEDMTARGMRRVPPYVQRINMQFLSFSSMNGPSKIDGCFMAHEFLAAIARIFSLT
jgi:hypothetical protein